MATMNVIDISSWQKGLDLSAVFADGNHLDGVVVKSTGGSSYVQPTCDAWIQWLIQNNKPFGFYHYMDDDYRHASGKAEAEWFVKNTRNYFGLGIPFADYEHPAKDLGTAYLKEFLDTVYALTGVKAGVYCSLSVIHSQLFRSIADAGYPLWVAQYADGNPVNGFLKTPWQNGSVSPFPKYWMHQYTSNGHLAGYSGRLDFNKFYGSTDDWNALAKGEAPAPTPTLKPAGPEIVARLLSGEFGTESERIRKLTEAGYDHVSVQKKVNELYAIAQNCKRVVGNNLGYIDSIATIMKG